MKYCPICTTDFPAEQSRCPQDGARLIEKDQWAPGTVIRNKYRILSCIGRGGMGIVYKAEHLVFKDLWALKVMNPRLSGEPEFVRRFYFEAEKQRKLKHRNVVRVDDVDESEDGKLFIGMEFVDGMPLREMMQAAQGPLALPLALAVVRGVAEALEAADALGLVHRDIKPDNVLMAREPNGGYTAKLTDFGVAKLREGTATLSKAPMLTPQYAAPEQWQPRADRPLSGRTDLYALGVMFFELVTGRLPFEASSDREWMYAHLNQEPPLPSSYNPAVADIDGLDAVIQRLLAKDSDERPEGATELLRELNSLDVPMPRARPASAGMLPGGGEPTRRLPTAGPGTGSGARRASSRPPVAARTTTHAPGSRRVPSRYREAEPDAAAAEVEASVAAAPGSKKWRWGAVAIVALATGAAAYYFWPGGRAAVPAAPATSIAASRPAALPLAVPERAPAPAAATGAPATGGAAAPIPDATPAPPTRAANSAPPTEPWGRPLTGHTDAVAALAFSPRGLRLASGSDDQSMKLWDLANGATTARTLAADAYVHAVAFSPDGRQLAEGDSSNQVVVWDAASGKPLHQLNGHHDQVEAVVFNPADGHMLASGGDDKAVRIWNVANQTTSPTLSGTAGIEALAFSPDGRLLAAGEDDHTVSVWQVGSWNIVTPGGLPGPGLVRSVAFDPKGRWLAAGGNDDTVRVWDVGTWSLTAPALRGHRALVTAVAFSPDGRWLASGSGDGTVRLWDTSTWNPFTTLAGPGGGVRGLAFSADGHLLAAAGGDHTIKLWRRPGS